MSLTGSIAVVASALTAFATPVTTNAPIVVTASRVGRTVEEMPANVTVITAEAIRDSGAPNVVSALETLGGVYFRRSSDNPGQADISMRGFSQNSHGRVLVLLDGQRLNSVDMSGIDWLRIPISAVERIEVLHGGQTALYGNYAVAGVISITTRKPSDEPSTMVSTTAGSDNTLAGHVGHAGSVGNTRYTTDVDWMHGDGWRDHSAYENTDIRASLAREWTDRLLSTLSAFYTENSSELPGYLTAAQLQANPRESLPFLGQGLIKSRTFGGSLGAIAQAGEDGRLEGELAASHRTTHNTLWSKADASLDSVMFTPRYTTDWTAGGLHHRLLIGADFAADHLSADTFTLGGAPTFAVLFDRLAAGLFVQNETELSETVSLVLGGRLEACRYSADIQDLGLLQQSKEEKEHRGLAGDGALVWKPTASSRFYARVAHLYRYPFLDEQANYRGYGAFGFHRDVGAEQGLLYETGGSVTFAREWTARASVYQMNMHDEIAWQGGFLDGQNRNLDDTRRRGAEMGVCWVRRGVGMFDLAYDVVDAEFVQGINRSASVPLVPEHQVHLRGEIELAWDLAAMAGVRLISSQYTGDDNGNDGEQLPGYGTLDLGLRYHPHQVQNLDVLLGVDNVLDHIYANTAYYGYGWGDSFYPAAGRTWKVTVMYRF